MKPADLRKAISAAASKLTAEVDKLTAPWAEEITQNLIRHEGGKPSFPKTFTDPVHGPIDLYGWEIAILDSSLLQRLRGIRQLGLAPLVYPSATHDRLSHSIGVVEVAEQMMQALKRNAKLRSDYGVSDETSIPAAKEDDFYTIRLAALLHDTGHAVFSHASEAVVERAYAPDFAAVETLLVDSFDGAKKPKPSEMVAILFVMSEGMRGVFEHAAFKMPYGRGHGEIPLAVAARILGARSHVDTPYFSAIISGPIDADKLDYMARDSYFTGLPVGLDIRRLVSKLEVVGQSADAIRDPLLREVAQNQPGQRHYQLGISLAGLTAYEQMIIGRVLLYDRVYYHHKVRSAEALVRKLFATAAEERGQPFALSEFYADFSDDSMLRFLASELVLNGLKAGGVRSQRLSRAIRCRRLFHRAYAFAHRFVAIPEGLEGKPEGTETKTNLWNRFANGLTADVPGVEKAIYDRAMRLMEIVPEFQPLKAAFDQDHVIVDLPPEQATTSGQKLMMRTEDGGITEANLFFEPEKWSDAYRNQKQCGFVFTPDNFVRPVAMATQMILFERFAIVMRREVQHLCKIDHLLKERAVWLKLAQDNQSCTPACFDALTGAYRTLCRIRADQITPPKGWPQTEPDFSKRIEDEFALAAPAGFVASVAEAIANALNNLCYVIDMFEDQGVLNKLQQPPDEKRELQKEILKALTARGCNAREGQEVGAGETDLVLPGDLVLENKVEAHATTPEGLKPHAPWQGRRYAFTLNGTCLFVLIAYKPKDETCLLSKPKRIRVMTLGQTSEGTVCVELLVPWGHGVPSEARAPKKTGP